MNVLKVSQVSKRYRQYARELYRFLSWLGVHLGTTSEQWPLKNVSLQVGRGQTVGIVGRNGAGKSTLLKIIAGVLAPTEGKVQVHGRVTAVLELGMGFNEDLTGRQNAVYSAGLMGFDSAQIEAFIDAIAEFSELGDYFDQPLRVYSSGMQARLAFAVATASPPELLIIDEALSVGDVAFQQKSFDRLKQFQQQGSSILFVSHDRNAVLTLCDEVVLLDHGEVIRQGAPEEIMDFYNALLAKESGVITQQTTAGQSVQTSSGTGEVTTQSIALLNEAGQESSTFATGSNITLVLKVLTHSAVERLVMGFSIRDRLGQTLFGTNTALTHQCLDAVAANTAHQFRVTFPANLGVGAYTVQTALVDSKNHLNKNYEWRDVAATFHVVNVAQHEYIGSTWLPTRIKIDAQ